MKKARQVLETSRLFGGLSEEHLQEIETIAVEKRFGKGGDHLLRR